MSHLPVSRIIVAAFIIIILARQPPQAARADVGLPPVSPSGSSLSPEGQPQTNVRMVAEEVNLTVEPYERPVPPDQIGDFPGYWMRVQVDAQFVMRNLGDAPEAFDVWFPLAATTRYPDFLLYETSRSPESIIQDFRVHVDGQPVQTEQVMGPALNLPEGESPWATFPVEFPPGQAVLIRVRYTLYPGGRHPFGDIEYILQTGAGWRDTIGEATIIAHLPDPVTPESVSQGSTDIFGDPLAPQPAGYVVEGETITWHFTNLEPGPQDNIRLNVLEPQRYARLLQARRKVEQANPDNPAQAAAAHLEQARASREAVLIIKGVMRNGGGPVLADEASAAYRRTLELNPDQPAVYSEYANWLMIVTRAWMRMETEGTCPPEVCELVQRGLEKYPQDAALQDLDRMFQDSLTMHQTEVAYATQDALATGTQQAQETQTALETQAGRATKTPKPTPTPVPDTATVPPTAAQAEITPGASPQPSPAAVTATAPAGGSGACPGGAIPLALAGLLAGMAYFHRRDAESTEKIKSTTSR